MIKIDNEAARTFVKKSDLEVAVDQAEKAFGRLREGSGAGNEWLGWRRILREPDEHLLERIELLAGDLRRRTDICIICGIGGSWLGARAVIEALRGPFPGDGPEILFAGHHMGGAYLKRLIGYLNRPNSNGELPEVWLNVISKSGTTLETALSFRVLRRWMFDRYGSDAAERIAVTTAPQGGVLNTIADELECERFEIPDDVGGRFSVLTPVGLLPAALAGVDIRKLFSGAVNAFRDYEESADDLLEYAALRFSLHQQGRAVDVIGSFEPELNAFSDWIQQLLGESEGKSGKGIFPVPAAYSSDLHSIGQMVQEGRRNLLETLLVVGEGDSTALEERIIQSDDGLDDLTGKSFHEINRMALEGTAEAHLAGGVPVFRIHLQRVDEESIGRLIYLYELFTAIYVYTLGVNPFDQPGVEAYKKAMYRNLGRG